MEMKYAFMGLVVGCLMIGCVSCADYPQNEPSLTYSDNHISGPGSYGGTEAPTNNSTQTPAPATNPTQ